MSFTETLLSSAALIAAVKEDMYNALLTKGHAVSFDPMRLYADAIYKIGQRTPLLLVESMPFTNGTEPSTGNVWYVSPGGRGLRNGTNWDNAFATRQEAVDASSAGDHIRVWEGTYLLAAVQTPKALVSEYYGFNGNGTWAERQPFTHPSKHDALFSANNFIIVTTNMTTEVIDGLWIQNTMCTNGGISCSKKAILKNITCVGCVNTGAIGGGGILSGAAVTGAVIDNCAIVGTTCSEFGGGIRVSGTVTNTLCVNCKSASRAGGIYADASNCTLIGCEGSYGGGSYGSAIDSTYICCNAAYGGGIHNSSGNELVKNVVFISCKASSSGSNSGGGGAICSYGNMYNCTAINCADATGWSIFMMLAGATRIYNTVAYNGPIRMHTASLYYDIRNCASNQALSFNTGADTNAAVTDFLTLTESPFVSAGTAPFDVAGVCPTGLTRSDAVSELLFGTVCARVANPRLLSTSPLIGAGYYEEGLTPTTDIDGNVRPNPPSIGAYEYAGTP